MVEAAPDRVVLSDRVVKAATRVCAKKAFLDRLRQEWGLLCLVNSQDRKGQTSPVLVARPEWRKGAKILEELESWLACSAYHPSAGPSRVIFAYLYGVNEKDQSQAAAAMQVDLWAVERMTRLVRAESARLDAARATKWSKQFLPFLAQTILLLTVEFDLPKTELSDTGAVVRLMQAIGDEFGVRRTSASYRKALAAWIKREGKGGNKSRKNRGLVSRATHTQTP